MISYALTLWLGIYPKYACTLVVFKKSTQVLNITNYDDSQYECQIVSMLFSYSFLTIMIYDIMYVERPRVYIYINT